MDEREFARVVIDEHTEYVAEIAQVQSGADEQCVAVAGQVGLSPLIYVGDATIGVARLQPQIVAEDGQRLGTERTTDAMDLMPMYVQHRRVLDDRDECGIRGDRPICGMRSVDGSGADDIVDDGAHVSGPFIVLSRPAGDDIQTGFQD